MVEITDRAAGHRASARQRKAALARLRDVALSAWNELACHVTEPNGYYLPDWALAVDASARGRSNVLALCGWSASHHLAALLPVISAWRAFRLPLPMLVAAESYGTLRTPLLAENDPVTAARRLIDEARNAGAHAILLCDVPLDGAAVVAFRDALARDRLTPTVLHSYPRACLDATRDADTLLREALAPKKLKELRRQRRRLSEQGEIAFSVATAPHQVAAAIETFLALEASGWKAQRGTALAQHQGDAAFIRRGTAGLAASGQCEIAILAAGATPVAAGIVLRHDNRAFWFKLGIDERFAQCSPGVQLAIELTRHYCADPTISFVDSTAPANSPMINPIWRNRFLMGDLLIPLRSGDPWVPVIRGALRVYRLADTAARRLLHAMRRLQARRR